MILYIKNYPKIMLLVIVTVLSVVVHGLFAQEITQNNEGFAVAPDGFQPLSRHSGWLLVEGQLYWTNDGGNTWQNHTPGNSGDRRILAGQFLNPLQGWLVAVRQSSSGQPILEVARSSDGGSSWAWSNEGIFDQPGEAFFPGHAQIQFLDDQHGWLVLSRPSSSNFNSGELYSTSDGGESWVKRNALSGGPVRFISPQQGWMIAGPLDQEIHQSQDGGDTWQEQRLPDLGLNDRRQFYLPSFSEDGQGTLPVLLPSQKGTLLRYYHSADHGQTWYRGTDAQFDTEFGQTHPIAFAQGQTLVSIPSNEFNRNSDMAYSFAPQSVNSPHFQALALHSAEYGWGLRVLGSCHAKSGCTQNIRLLKTEDAGLTWSEMSTPQQHSVRSAGGVEEGFNDFPSLAVENGLLSTSLIKGQGFDKCEVPTTSQLQTWSSNSPYRAVNLYIGGACRSCSNQALSSTFLSKVQSQGWRFIPTWVGPQSSCYSGCGGKVFSNDVATAYQQGMQEADAALAEAIRLGLAASDGSGTIVYYDLEAYSSISTDCRNAAKSFVSGWTKRLQDKGSKAGLYGATCGSILRDFASIENVPDAVWAANWTYSSYNSEASVWDLQCFENELWPNNQRLRQYAGGHAETWGGISLTIDNNVLDGIVAAQQPASPPSPTATVTNSAPPTTTATPTSTPDCEQNIILNSGFENETGWTIPDTTYLAGYSTEQVRSGNRSMRAGIVNTQDNLYSYSSAKQTVTIPKGAKDQILHFWLYPQSTETGAVRLPEKLLSLDDNDTANKSDLQLVLILDSGGQMLERLFVDRLNDQAWREFSFDISQYSGKTIQVYFGVFNNGTGGRTGMYVDDVSLGSCDETEVAATATATYTATPRATATAKAAATATPSAAATPSSGNSFLFFAPTMFNDFP